MPVSAILGVFWVYFTFFAFKRLVSILLFVTAPVTKEQVLTVLEVDGLGTYSLASTRGHYRAAELMLRKEYVDTSLRVFKLYRWI